MAAITLEQVAKTYPNGYVAARALSLEIVDGELLVLVGPSGSGKSTILRLIAGLEPVSGGRILIGGRDVTDLPPQRRDLAMVFQSYALYPHMTVRENLAFGLRVRKTGDAEIARRVAAAAAALGLEPLLDRKPAQLSGGQRQRVALGRAMVREPQAFLLDEPLSNLDARLRLETRVELARLHRRLGATMVYVTHDQVEAMTLGDRVAVLDAGVLQQVAPPMELYRRPANRFVAGFIGSPAMNFVAGELQRRDGGTAFVGGGLAVPLANGVAGTGPAVLGVRPQQIELAPTGPEAIPATVQLSEPLGSEQVVHLLTAGGTPLVAVAPPEPALAAGSVVGLRLPAEVVHLFDAGSGERLGG
jgi:multiple sugar transport system ATP-binding protein